MDTLKGRLLIFLKYTGIGQTAFENNVGIARGYISNNKGNMTSKVIDRIRNAYPELNTDWLLTGQGQMLNPHPGQPGIAEKVAFYDPFSRKDAFSDIKFVDAGDTHTGYEVVISELKKRIELLEKLITEKDARIANLNELITMLRKQGEDTFSPTGNTHQADTG